MGRSPCCDKVGIKRGPWTPEEDQKLLAYIQQNGHGSWRALPSKAGLQRCGKSCRLRWINYLRPDIKRGKFSLQEEQTIIQLHALLGSRWSAIAAHLSERTDNEIKNHWNTHLKKRLVKMGIDPVSHKPKNDTPLSNDGRLKSTAKLSHMAQWESARLEAEARLVKQSKLQSMSPPANQVSSTVRSLTSVSSRSPWKGTGNRDHTESPTERLSTNGIRDSFTDSFELVVGVDGSLGSCDDEPAHKDHENGTNNTVYRVNDYVMPPAIDGTWSMTDQPLKSGIDYEKHVSNDDFLESFTRLLIRSSNRSSFARSDDDSDMGLVRNDDGGGEGGIMKDYYAEKKNNYWDTILNLA